MPPRSEEVQWQLGPTTVHGTLLTPEGPGPFPAVVLVAGSGPTDRDWNSPLLPGTNGSARLIARALAEHGFASLRYDKRAAGPHAAANMRILMGTLSMRSHVEEFAEGVRLLARRQDIQPTRIFGLGHSEGTLHVLDYQLTNPAVPLAGLILAGPPARPVGAVARWQLAAQAATRPDGDALLALFDEAVTRFLHGEPAAPDSALPEGLRNLLAALEAPANLPFARELWTADAASRLRRVQVPVLVIIGKKDIQVDWQLDGELLAQATQRHPDATLLFPDNANHVLKHECRPRAQLVPGEVLSRYNAEDTRLDPETIGAIVTWLAARAA
jgi:pimeloyl-ACP methyl ester carboxylesterase